MAIYDQSPTITQYKQTMKECLRLYFPDISNRDLDEVLDYSISKRYKEHGAYLKNSYTHKESQTTLLQMADYINSREPIVTVFGTMFKHHGDVPNPLAVTIDEFLELRNVHKKEMFKYPKGSEFFERYNLLQQLDKIDANG